MDYLGVIVVNGGFSSSARRPVIRHFTVCNLRLKKGIEYKIKR